MSNKIKLYKVVITNDQFFGPRHKLVDNFLGYEYAAEQCVILNATYPNTKHEVREMDRMFDQPDSIKGDGTYVDMPSGFVVKIGKMKSPLLPYYLQSQALH